MLYEFAIEEYENEPEVSKHKIIYAYFWLAIYKWQCLEKWFTNMMWLKKSYVDKFSSQEEFNRMVDEIEWKKGTMWQQINELKNIYNFSDDIVLDLEEVLKIRNNLTHNYFKDNPEKFFSNKWSKEMLKYFTSFIEKTDELDKKLDIYTEKYIKKLWISKTLINELIDDLTKKEKQRDF